MNRYAGASVFAITAIALCAFVSGCSKPDKPVFKVEQSKIVTLNPPVGTVVTKKGGKFGETVIEKHITYANGDVGHVFYRDTDGTKRLVREEYSDGVVKAKATFDEKERLISGEIRRPNDTRYMYVQAQKDGSQQVTYYNTKGKKAVFREKVADGSSYQDTYYREDGSTMGKVDVLVQANGRDQDNWIDVFPRNERHFKIQFMAAPDSNGNGYGSPFSPYGYPYGGGGGIGGQLISYFNDQGQTEFTQLWRSGNWQRSPMGNMHLEQVDEYDYTGKKVSRSLWFQDENNVVSILRSKSEQWAGNGNVELDGASLGITDITGINGLQVLQSTPAPSPRPVVQNGMIEVIRHYRIGEKDIKDEDLEVWTEQQPWVIAQPIVTYKRVFHSGTLEKIQRGDKEVEVDADRNLHEPGVVLSRLKGVKYDELQTARSLFQREDTSFLGEADNSDPCRWYLRK